MWHPLEPVIKIMGTTGTRHKSTARTPGQRGHGARAAGAAAGVVRFGRLYEVPTYLIPAFLTQMSPE